MTTLNLDRAHAASSGWVHANAFSLVTTVKIIFFKNSLNIIFLKSVWDLGASGDLLLLFCWEATKLHQTFYQHGGQ